MKSRFLRILSMILILASLVSMLGIFAYAAETDVNEDVGGGNQSTDTENPEGPTDPFADVRVDYPHFELLYQRNFEEGWGITNGMSWVDRGSFIDVDYEMTPDYRYNYFFRFTVGSKENSYLEMNFNNADKVGTVFEFDIKSDDFTNIKGLLHFGTLGSPSANRENPQILQVINGEMGFFGGVGTNAGEGTANRTDSIKLTDEWMHIAIVFDYTWGDVYDEVTGTYYTPETDADTSSPDYNPNEDPHNYDNYFTASIYYAPTDEYKRTGELNHYDTRTVRGKVNGGGEGISLMRIGTSGEPESNFGTSVCFDNMVAYNGANVYGLATPEMGCGVKVNPDDMRTEEILGDNDAGSKSRDDYINEASTFKVGVDYFKSGTAGRTPIMLDENGEAYGAPIVNEGDVMLPLLPLLDSIGFSYYEHEDGMYVDISTGDASSYISVGKNSATVNGKRVTLNRAPGYYGEEGKKLLYVALDDIETLLPGKYVDYDDMGIFVVGDQDDLLDRNVNLRTMLETMKVFVFDYATPEEITERVEEHTNGFDHPYLFANQEKFDELRAIRLAKVGDEAYVADFSPRLNNLFESYAWYYEARFAAPILVPVMDEVVKTDDDGNPVQKLDPESGEPMFDEDGNPVYEYVEVQRTEQKIQYDENGDPIVLTDPESGEPILDEDGEEQYVYADEPVFDENYDYYVGLLPDDVLIKNGFKAIQPYLDNGHGYDLEGGRSNLESSTTYIRWMALCWQLSRDVRYLLCAYDMAIKIVEGWVHWGPGHFLNVADGGTYFAMFYDWCYDGIVALANGSCDFDGNGIEDEEELAQADEVEAYLRATGRDRTYFSTKRLADDIYEKAVYEGVIACMDIQTTYVSPIVGTGGSFYHTRENNWNAVCSAGMIMCSLVILDREYEVDFSAKNDAVVGSVAENAAWLISDNIYNLAKYGLDCYAPDGAYNEGPGYWNYGTNNFFELCESLASAAGSTFGLMDCWAIDQTSYYACHSESSDFRTFNYHDGAMGTQATDNFFFCADYFNDPALAEIRLTQIQNGKGLSMFDIFYYPVDGVTEASDPPLDYYSVGIDLYTARSSWEKGALYVGIIGGNNNHTHNQIDAGSFVYHNDGIVWFIDLGTENYNAIGFWGAATRYRYYVMKPEGNNTLALTSDVESLPWGQELYGGGKAYDYGYNEFGSYVKYEMTTAFGNLANSWKRAVMLTNNRKTTIIQDEVSLKGNQRLYWFGHYSSSYVSEVELSDDGRTAYMYNKRNMNGDVLRVTLVSEKSNLRFTIMDTYTFVHNDPEKGTYHKDWVNAQGPDENNRSAYSKLAIDAGGGLSFNVAVVLEMVDRDLVKTVREPEVKYNWTAIDRWEEPVENYQGIAESEDAKRGVPQRGAFRSNIEDALKYVEKGTAYGDDFDTYYRLLTDIYYIFVSLEQQLQGSAFEEAIKTFEQLKNDFSRFRNNVNTIDTGKDMLVNRLFGYQ